MQPALGRGPRRHVTARSASHSAGDSTTAPLIGTTELAIHVATSTAEQLPLAEVKDRLSEVVAEVESQHAGVTITKHGRPAAVIVSTADLESLEETLLVLPDPAILSQLRDSRNEAATGESQKLTKEEALAKIGLGRV